MNTSILHLRNLLDKAFVSRDESVVKLQVAVLQNAISLESVMAVPSHYEDNHRVDC